jgi:hypothetical protein
MATTIQPKLIDSVLVFVCHYKKTTQKCLEKYPDSFVVFVGPDVIDPHPRVTILRNLKYNIEHERTLLTFTAWYAIIKNNLFTEYKYICIFEYDIILTPNFNTKLNELTTNDYGLITFIPDNRWFTKDITVDILNSYMKTKFSNYSSITTDIDWYLSTNHCIRRDKLKDFVDFYYPSCLDIKELDKDNFSWYHERIFTLYIKYNNIRVGIYNEGIHHLKGCSHAFNNINRFY